MLMTERRESTPKDLVRRCCELLQAAFVMQERLWLPCRESQGADLQVYARGFEDGIDDRDQDFRKSKAYVAKCVKAFGS